MKHKLKFCRLWLKRLTISGLSLVVCLGFFSANSYTQPLPIYDSEAIFHPVIASEGMVATQEQLATVAGLEVLKEGGNAIDAAVTVGFTLAVTLPRAGNLGGGGFMLVHLAENNQTLALDYREKAPLAATREMFLTDKGEVDQEKSRFSHLAVGVPGTVAGLIFALENYGTISLARALQPAIDLAENGLKVNEDLSDSLSFAREWLEKSPASRTIFLPHNGQPLSRGELLIQKDLAESLTLIKRQGKKAFYQGQIAQKIVREMAKNGGLITLEDLAKYRPVIREPVKGNYQGFEIYSMPPPSSGGVHLIQMLNILARFPLQTWGRNTAQTIHVMAETMKLAYADRAKYLGDPDFVEVPISGLISPAYAAQLQGKIDLNRATPSSQIMAGNPLAHQESHETTHYSIVDRYGNAVANTYTLNFSYGSGITVPETGILLNNQMDDFAAKPGVPNAFGLTGGDFNAIAPEKRMLSSMTPTIILKDGEVFLVTGSPGGSRIFTAVLQVIVNAIAFGNNIAEATAAPRFHHQWLPDKLYVEKDLSLDTINLLKQRGHEVVVTNAIGSTQSIMKVGDYLYGTSDPRRRNALTTGF